MVVIDLQNFLGFPVDEALVRVLALVQLILELREISFLICLHFILRFLMPFLSLSEINQHLIDFLLEFVTLTVAMIQGVNGVEELLFLKSQIFVQFCNFESLLRLFIRMLLQQFLRDQLLFIFALSMQLLHLHCQIILAFDFPLRADDGSLTIEILNCCLLQLLFVLLALLSDPNLDLFLFFCLLLLKHFLKLNHLILEVDKVFSLDQ